MGEKTSRFCEYERDRERLIEFLLEYRAATDVRLYPTIWRVRLLLTSRVWEAEKDTQIWENKAGQVIGFAMLWRRQSDSPYIVLDGFVHPKYLTKNLLKNMLEWGNERSKEIGVEQKASVTVFANGFSQDIFADQIQNEFGYIPISPNPDEYNVYFSKELGEKISVPLLPEGYTINSLSARNSLEQYQTLYGFAQVNPMHQKELLESDEYSHLVVVDPNGEYVAYCECSICRVEWERTNCHIGWIDYVETKPDCQRNGFGRVALVSGLSKLQEWGADTAMLITINTNTPAVKLYNKVGFEPLQITEILRYEKRIAYQNQEQNEG